jgi:peroxiredoxin
LPSLEKLYAEMRGEPFVLLAVALREERQSLRRFVAQNRLTFPILLDDQGSVAASFKVRGVPSAVLIDSAGDLAAVTIGAVHWEATRMKELMGNLL